MITFKEFLNERISTINPTGYNNDTDTIEKFVRACGRGNLEEVKDYIEKENVNPNAENSWGHTPLGNAIANNKLETINYLLSTEADPSKIKKDEIVRIHNIDVLKRVADIVPEEELYNAMWSWINDKVNEELLDVALEKLTKEHLTELVYVASMKNNLDALKLLIEKYKASPDAVSEYSGFSAMMTALRNNNYEVVEYLISKGANTKLKLKGKTAKDFTNPVMAKELGLNERVSTIRPTEKRKVSEEELVGMIYDGKSIDDVDYSHITDMSDMFRGMVSLEYVPKMDTSNVTNMRNMFKGCNSLVEVEGLDTSKVTDMYSMFEGCSSLEKIPDLDTSNVTDMRYMFKDCRKLHTIPKMNTEKVRLTNGVFAYCNSIETIERPSDWYNCNWIAGSAPAVKILRDKYPELYNEDLR